MGYNRPLSPDVQSLTLMQTYDEFTQEKGAHHVHALGGFAEHMDISLPGISIIKTLDMLCDQSKAGQFSHLALPQFVKNL
jgi:hypothetical protein